jgi:DNA-binding FadR family transcriptional regulator
MATKSTQSGKTGFLLANRIAKDIIDQNLSPGVLFGREPELLAQYGISRDPFREAVRILEWQGLAKSVRGSGGGLRVGNLNPDTISNIIRDYLFLSNTPLSQLIEANRAFAEYAIDLLAAPDQEQIKISLLTLKSSWKGHLETDQPSLNFYRKMLIQLMKYTHNPAFGLFLTPILDVLSNASKANLEEEQNTFDQSALDTLFRCIEFSVLGENTQAKKEINSFLDALQQHCEHKIHRAEIPYWLENTTQKKAQVLVYKLHQTILENKLQPGVKIGLEPELLEKYQVSRAVFREAIRQLEIIGLVTQKKGRSGGLMVSAPNPSSLIPVAVIYLFHAHLDYKKFDESRKVIEVKAAELAAKKITNEEIIELKTLSRNCSESCCENYIYNSLKLHVFICEISGNPILSMYMKILAQASQLPDRDTDRLERLHSSIDELKISQTQVVTAVINKDPELARTRMMIHRLLVANCLR